MKKKIGLSYDDYINNCYDNKLIWIDVYKEIEMGRMNIVLKYTFNNNFILNVSDLNNVYNFFDVKGSGLYISVEYVGNSKIDGRPYFNVLSIPPTISASDCTMYNGVSVVKKIELIQSIADYNTYNVENNKEKLLKYFLERFNISDIDLVSEESFKRVMRDLNIGNILEK